jgi:hypothetical protein
LRRLSARPAHFASPSGSPQYRPARPTLIRRATYIFPLPGNQIGSQVVVLPSTSTRALAMNGIIYLVGLVVVILAVLSFFGLR